jgi:hypothetical protein
MVNQRLKQAAALFIAIAFVSSIFFFFPHIPNNSSVTYYIVVPASSLKSNYTSSFGTISVQKGVSDSIIALSQGVPISNLLTSNISTMLSFTESVFAQENISYNISGGSIECAFSKEFISPLCADPVNNTAWGMFSEGSNGQLSPVQEALSGVSLKSISSNSTFILVFFSNSNLSSSSSVPPINLG